VQHQQARSKGAKVLKCRGLLEVQKLCRAGGAAQMQNAEGQLEQRCRCRCRCRCMCMCMCRCRYQVPGTRYHTEDMLQRCRCSCRCCGAEV